MDLILPCLTTALAKTQVLLIDGSNCKDKDFSLKPKSKRSWPNEPLNNKICRAWIKELGPSELYDLLDNT